MKRFFTIILLAAAFGANAQHMQEPAPKLSPLTRMLVKQMSEMPNGNTNIPDGYFYKLVNGKPYISGMIKVANEQAVAARLEDMGAIVGTKAGNIWTVLVPYDKVPLFTQTKGISYIQLDEPVRPAMEQANKLTRVDSVHRGFGLPWPMTGLGTVVGVIDFGFDYNHPVFYDTTGTNYRVKKAWELGTTGTPPSGFSYGHEVVGQTALVAQGTDNAQQSHGTAVAGVSSGSGFGTTGNKLRGVAYQSDMVFVSVRRDFIASQWLSSSFSDFADGVNYIFQYANSVSKPAVVNISWGSQSGPHDGTSLFAQACDNLSGTGKIIVMSAGNDGQEPIHLSKTFTNTDTAINTFVTFTSPAMKRTWVDVWGDTAKTFCAKVTLYSKGVAGNTTGYVCIDDQTHNMYVLGANGTDTCYVNFITSSSEYNDKPRITVDIYNKAVDSIQVSVKGTSGSIDMWNEYYYYGYTYGYQSAFESLGIAGNVNGDVKSTVSDMGSAKSVLLIGAYTSKNAWVDIASNPLSYAVTVGAIAPFSSRGPMADGRVKPDIAAPGLTLANATSSYDVRYTPTGTSKQQVVSSYNFGSKTYYFAEFSGTSASAPMASGVVSLMLQANPKLTPAETRNIMTQTAIKDLYTGTLPGPYENTWGAGKLNAAAAVRAAHQMNSVYDFKGEKLDCALFPSPNNGSFTLNFAGAKTEELKVTICDIAGRVVAAENWKVNAGENYRKVQLPKVAAGTYVVTISSAVGSVNIKTQVQ